MTSFKLGWTDRAFVTIGLASVLISFLVSASGEDPEWFQRSGSLLVIFAAVFEARLQRLSAPVRSKSVFVGGSPLTTWPELTVFQKALHLYALSGLVLGTLIWGYGDLIFAAAEKAEGVSEQQQDALRSAASVTGWSIIFGCLVLMVALKQLAPSKRVAGIFGVLFLGLAAGQAFLIGTWKVTGVILGALSLLNLVLAAVGVVLIVRWVLESDS